MPAFPLINGDYYSFQDIELTFSGNPGPPLPFIGLKSINYSDNLSRTFVRGTARKPIGMTAGHYEAKGDFEMYLPAFNALINQLVGLDVLGIGWRRYSYTVSVSYASVLGLPVITDLITGIRLTEVEASQSEGEDPLVRKMTMMPQEVLWNGVPSVIETTVPFAIG